MNSKNKNTLIGSAIFIGLVYLIFRKPKSEKKSNLVDEMIDNMGKPITQFTITNSSSIQQTVTLFDAYNNINNVVIPPTPPPTSGGMVVAPAVAIAPTPPTISVNPSMSFFNQTLLNEPKKVKSIQIRVNNSAFAQAQATQLITRVCKDASGDSDTKNYFPMVATGQVQGNITEIKPKNLILDGHCVLNYVVQPNTTVTWVMEYETKRK